MAEHAPAAQSPHHHPRLDQPTERRKEKDENYGQIQSGLGVNQFFIIIFTLVKGKETGTSRNFPKHGLVMCHCNAYIFKED